MLTTYLGGVLVYAYNNKRDETKEGMKMIDNWMCIWTTSVSVNLSCKWGRQCGPSVGLLSNHIVIAAGPEPIGPASDRKRGARLVLFLTHTHLFFPFSLFAFPSLCFHYGN